MPRSVRVAVVVACVVALLGVTSIVIWAADLVTGDSASAALGTRFSLVGPLFIVAGAVPVAAARRDGRVRELAFQFALLQAILLGLIAPFAAVVAFVRGLEPDLILSLVVFGLAVALAASLSRPSAKAWFRSGGPPPGST